MGIALGVVDDRLLLNALFRGRQVDDDIARGGGGGGEGGDLDRVQGLAGVTVGGDGEVTEGFRRGVDGDAAQAAVGVGEGTVHKVDKILGSQRLQLEDLRARDQGELTKKNGFSVVAPMNRMTPFSTSGRSTSCWAD